MTPEEMATHRQAGGRSGVTREVLSGYRKSPPARKTFSLGCCVCGGVQLGDVGDKVTSSRNGKGLDSRTPSSSPGVGY